MDQYRSTEVRMPGPVFDILAAFDDCPRIGLSDAQGFHYRFISIKVTPTGFVQRRHAFPVFSEAALHFPALFEIFSRHPL